MRTCVAWITAALALVACAPLPPTPDTIADLPSTSAKSPAIDQAIARHRQLARKYGDAGDLAAAATEWHILMLLDPQEPAYREQRDAALAERARATQASLDAGRAARRSGQTERALQAFLRALALDPGNEEAARAARELDRQKYARIQQDRAARARPEGAAPAPGAPSRAMPAEANGDGYDIEQALEMLSAGDIAGGLRDLRDWVASNPGNRTARRRIGTAVYDKARELEAGGAREQALALYDAALALRGESVPEWSARATALRRPPAGNSGKPVAAPR